MTAYSGPTRSQAEELDGGDELASFRERFCLPKSKAGDELVYLTGNSLGLMPHSVREFVKDELDAWETLAVDGHFEGKRPWYGYHEQFTEIAAHIVGARSGEVVIMNSLTANLHVMMATFYRPTKERFRIVIEQTAFPSDIYAVHSQARLHGFDEDAIVTLAPREGEATLRTEDIEKYLAEHGSEVALVLMGGVNFYTGQAYEFARIAKAAHDAGAYCGFDLAHAAGNLRLQLHDDDVDFAPFCTYKYLNAGPGSVAGCFVHERHGNNLELPRMAGWWGNDPDTRFEMSDEFVPQPGAAGWQMSNAPVLSMAALLASMRIFEEAGIERLRAKSERLTGFLLECIDGIGSDALEVLTPRDVNQRGCQLSVRFGGDTKALRDLLQQRGVVSDYRPPDVIRVAPVPLYNTFLDAWRFADVLREAVEKVK